MKAGFNNCQRWLIAATLVFLWVSLAWTGALRPSVLVVHSQDKTIPWTRGINVGIDTTITPISNIRLHKSHISTSNGANPDTQISRTQRFIKLWQPSALIVVDDLAQTRIGLPYAANKPVIYTGIEDHERSLASLQASGVRGIAQRTPWDSIEHSLVRAVQLNAPSHKASTSELRIALISDTGPAAEEEARSFEQHTWKLAKPIGVWRCKNKEQWIAALHEIAESADIVVIGDYRYMQPSDSLNHKQWRRILAQEALDRLSQPIAALSAYALEDGIPMGILPSPMEQGEVAAKMALQQISKHEIAIPKQPSSLSQQHLQSQHFLLLLNPAQVQRRHLKVDALDAYYARSSARLIGVSAQ
ncbi:hypothetical protein KUF54_08725 [Comamonas sp. Y33R10-2]|uniref:hypothetical protein n=1 Tax=Comamonas sp. Y33R10-2 TaxID=2853257 RepID=UPI001C5C8CD5|nr:hypothetical protein [Comamonas sp. Y33R10-2]QXZ08216.1 hypothetical protein KUF54_08725 [Comamonas sp. Y33R10-2]